MYLFLHDTNTLRIIDSCSVKLINFFSFIGGFAWQIIGPETSFPYNVSNWTRAGRDADGSAIYAGRAFHEGELIPGGYPRQFLN